MRTCFPRTFSYLGKFSIDRFNPPVESTELTFIKRCRLVDVRLFPDGIVASGMLWELHTAIDTGKFTSELQPERRYSHGLNECQRSQLQQLFKELRKNGYNKLADDLDDYLHEDTKDQLRPSKQNKDLMAEKIVEVIRNGKTIHLGCLAG